MVDLIPVVDGDVKFRDGKKWKMRYAVVTRLSPVADSLTFQIWKNRKDREVHSIPSKGSLVLEDYIGIETGFTLDKESLTLAILLKDMVISLAFNSREVLMRWQIRISSQFESGRVFSGSLLQAPPKLFSSSGPVRITVHNDRFYLCSGSHPFGLIHSWKISHLRRYGLLEDNSRFVFEGGSLCAKGEGLHILRLGPGGGNPGELKTAFDLAANRKLPTGSIASLNNTDSPGNSFSSSSSNSNNPNGGGVGGLSRLLRQHHFSTSCDTMSEVLSSEFNPSLEGLPGSTLNHPEESNSHPQNQNHLVNRRNLLEKIYSLCEISSEKIKSTVHPSWGSLKQHSSPQQAPPSGGEDNSSIFGGNGGLPHSYHHHQLNSSFDSSLISFAETESKYDNPRSALSNSSKQNLISRNSNNNNNGFAFENYDIPKAIPPASLYDVPRSLNSLQQEPGPLRSGEHHLGESLGASPGNLIVPPVKVRINGQGKMPLADLRNGGIICMNSNGVVGGSFGSPASSGPHYMNLEPQGGGQQQPLYENMVPVGTTADKPELRHPTAYPHYDTINIKLRKFHDLLNPEKSPSDIKKPEDDLLQGSFTLPSAVTSMSHKRKSTSLGSLLEAHLSEEGGPLMSLSLLESHPGATDEKMKPPSLSKSLSLSFFAAATVNDGDDVIKTA